MPTGYTAPIADDITFEQFAMGCARAFGATITMRDEPSGAEIPAEFKPSTYHAERLPAARAKLAELQALTPEEIERRAGYAYEDAERTRLEILSRSAELRAKYEAMLAQVNAWTPPSEEHERLKEFMAEQITQSIKHDCDDSPWSSPTERLTGVEWLRQALDAATWSVDYHEREQGKEIARTAQRNEWIRLLRESLATTAEASA